MILDIILVLIMAFSVYIGYKRGLVRTLASFLGKFIALSIAYFYHQKFKVLLVKFTGIDSFVLEKVKLSLKSLGGHAAESSMAGSDINAVGKMPLPQLLKDKMIEYLTESANHIGKSVASSLTDFIMNMISFFILFLLIAILISLIVRILNLIAKLPVIRTFNRLGGVLFSFITTYLILTIAFLLITSYVSMDISSKFATLVDNSHIAKYFISYNPILVGLANMSL